MRVRTGVIWVKIGSSGGVLTITLMNILFCEVLGVVDVCVKTAYVNELQSSVCM